MGFTEKTNYLLETKSLLKDRINSLGGSITSGTTFRDYLVWLDSLYEALDEKTITGLPDSLEGKCEQEGTPTPTNPVPINITTGRQVVRVSDGTTTNDYEINLGKNLYYMNYTDFSHTWNGLTITSTTTGYSISNTATGGGDYTLVNRYMTLPVGTYTMVLENASSMVVGLSKNNYASILRIPIGSTSGTFTLSEETKVCLTLRVVNGTTYDETNNIMIEKGSQATSYSPYKTPIYLGKIGNYKDYIFRNTPENPLYDSNLEEGQWYIHKEIGRVVLNGSESWAGNGQTTDFGQYVHTITDKAYGTTNMLCNTFNVKNTNAENSIAGRTTNSNIYITIEKSIVAYNTNTFKTWLSSHNVELYYVLNTPTNTLIEDEELINQLNEIEIFTVISEGFYN